MIEALIGGVTAGAVFLVVFFTGARIARARARRRAEQEMARAQEFLEEVRRRITGEFVKPADIKYGDNVCWSSTDHSKHVHYVAGFDGDPGPSADGVHMRPFESGRKK